MADKLKVLKGLKCCHDLQSGEINGRNCEGCPYNDDPEGGSCSSLSPLLADAIECLTQNQRERLVKAIENAENFLGMAPYLAIDFAKELVEAAKEVV
jgi:hypothetical protein